MLQLSYIFLVYTMRFFKSYITDNFFIKKFNSSF